MPDGQPADAAAFAADDPSGQTPTGDRPTTEEAAAGGARELAPAEDGRPGEALTEAQLEALLFVAERPLTRRELMSITGASREVLDARLGDLEVSLAGRGLRLLATGDRVVLGTAPEAGALIARYVGSDAIRLSPASLETLAIVAYRQPVTRSVIERIRGVDSDYTIRTLVHRRLVVELGRADAPGRPILFGTGFEFLERFGIVSLEELPPLDAAVEARLLEAQAVEGGAEAVEGEAGPDAAAGEPAPPDPARAAAGEPAPADPARDDAG